MAFKRRHKYNPKRKICKYASADRLAKLEHVIDYGGNPEHKRNPGDFGLEPPASPRPGKTLCDDAGIVEKEEAVNLLKSGAKQGLVSTRRGQGSQFPQNIWAVKDSKKGFVAFEAQLENPSTGTYHGYPMPEDDPLAKRILTLWKQ